MTPEQWKDTFLKPKNIGVTVLIGGLLQKSDEHDSKYKLIIRLKRIERANHPRVFKEPNEILTWLQDPDKWKKIAQAFVNGNQGTTLEYWHDRFKEVIPLWNDPLAEDSLERHEYRNTESCCDWEEFPGNLREMDQVERLFLWSFGKLKRLTSLPPKLRVLDLRHARSLTELANLPDTLETLDLSGCISLRQLPNQPLPRLKRLFLGGCDSLDQGEIERFWETGGFGETLEQLEVHELPWLEDLSWLRGVPRLRVLRAAKCPALRQLPQWRDWQALEHLDLRYNPGITFLPILPKQKLGFLGLFGCDGLRTYCSQDLNERDLGVQRTSNVSKLFGLRTRLGRDVTEAPRCKLLFLGNGRGGKTTLACAIQYKDMDEAQQQAHPELEPKLGTRSTHGVYLWNWKTQVTLSRNQNGEETEVQRDAQVRIWDFGGQETYHGTHRVFAASGALYILVVNDRPGDLVHQDSRLEEWVQEKINHQRPLQYWLDYIVDLNRMHRRDSAKAKVLLVRSNKTHRGEGERPWVELLAWDKDNSRHADRLKVVEKEYFVGSLKGEWSRTQFETPFFPDLKKYLGKQVLEEGIRVPRLFARVMQELRGWVEEIKSLSHEKSILTWNHWLEIIRGWALEEKVEGEPLTEWEVEALTAMLHEAGDLFWMRGEGGGWILVQQVLALKEIYRFLGDLEEPFGENREAEIKRHKAIGKFREEIRYNTFGLFQMSQLRKVCWPESTESGATLTKPVQDLLIRFMIQCQICVPVFPPDKCPEGVLGDWYLGLDPLLLPGWDQVYTMVESEFTSLSNRIDVRPQPSKQYRLLRTERGADPFSESDFRGLQAHAVTRLGKRIRCWVNGFQFTDEGGKDTLPLGYRVEWKGLEGKVDSYEGLLEVRLLGCETNPKVVEESWNEMIARVFDPSSPLPKERWKFDQEFALDIYCRELKQQCDFAQSVRGKQKDLAEQLEAALKKFGDYRSFLYCTDHQPNRMEEVYESIQRARVQILWITEDYLNPEELNQYSLKELALAICCWARRQGLESKDSWNALRNLLPNSDSRVVVVYQDSVQEGGTGFLFRSQFQERLEQALTAMKDLFDQKINRVSSGDAKQKNVDEYCLFEAALKVSSSFATFFVSGVNERFHDGEFSFRLERLPDEKMMLEAIRDRAELIKRFL